MLSALDVVCLVPLLPGAASAHPQHNRHPVALLLLLPTAQVSLARDVSLGHMWASLSALHCQH